jgi:prophage tail gpP-like protein
MGDTFSVSFNYILDSTKTYVIDDATSFHLEKDALTPSNSFVLVIEDSDVTKLIYTIQRGFAANISINGKPQMTGYIFNYFLSYNKNGGTKLTIECKDLLEYMAQYTCLPNIVVSNTRINVHFGPKDTLQAVLTAIAEAFYVTYNNGLATPVLARPPQVTVDAEHKNLELGSGFAFGLRTSTGGKSGQVTTKSLNTALEHLAQPSKGESYLAYMLRMCKLAGCHLKMANQCFDPNNFSQTIICKSPSYGFENGTPFSLLHSYTNPDNNVISGDIHYNLDHQPSIVIMEANTTGDAKFHLSTVKGLATNALTAYFSNQSNQSNSTAFPLPGTFLLPGVEYAIAALTQASNTNNYSEAPFNEDLFNQARSIPVDTSVPFSQPYYTVSPNAHTAKEAMIAAAEYLADCQDKYVEMTYVVQGWTMPGTDYIWQPDCIVLITDDALVPPGASSKSFPMWIRKVNFTQSKRDGTMTKLTCTLPFTHAVVSTA